MDIIDLVSDNLKFYDSIKPKNPPGCYTVIATVNDYQTGQLLCLATGTQANLKSNNDDIQDCHAESLVKRAFKRFVIDAVKDVVENSTKSDNLVELSTSRIPKSIILFVSKFPCGFLTRYEGQEPVDPTSGNAIKRKPGRGIERMGEKIYVEKDNCLVKLQKWVNHGFQGTKLKQALDIETSIKMVVIGHCESSEDFNYTSHLEEFSSRLGSKVEVCHVRHTRRDEFIFRPASKAQPVSVVWWRMMHGIPLEPNNNCEMIVDGRRRGLTRQQCSGSQIVTSARLKVADARLRNDLEYISTAHKASDECS